MRSLLRPRGPHLRAASKGQFPLSAFSAVVRAAVLNRPTLMAYDRALPSPAMSWDAI